MTTSLTHVPGSALTIVKACDAGPIPADDDLIIVPTGEYGNTPIRYGQYMATVRAALKSRIGQQLDMAMAAAKARREAIAAAADAAPVVADDGADSA